MNLPAQTNQTQAGSSYLYQYTHGADHERVNLIATRPDETISPGYRLYYTQRGAVVNLLLIGGNKSTQQRDVKSALRMARELKQERGS